MTTNGFAEHMPEREYHAHPAISKSGLDLIERSPAHFKHAPKREPTAAMMIGTAIHRAVLEPWRFDNEYVVCQAKDRRQKEYKDMVKAHGVEYVLMRSDHEHIYSVQKSINGNELAGPLARAEGRRELSAFTTDPVTGVPVKCRYDLLADNGFAVDLKKSRDVFPRNFSRAVASYRYHVQVAFYSDIYEWITGERLNEFWLLAVEGESPYTPVAYLLDDEAIEVGRRAYRSNLNTYAECLASDSWPHYEPEHPYLSLPEYMLGDVDELEV